MAARKTSSTTKRTSSQTRYKHGAKPSSLTLKERQGSKPSSSTTYKRKKK